MERLGFEMSTSEDHEGLADKLEQEAERLKRESRHLREEIDEVRADWRAKREDGSVPGAPPPTGDEADAG